MRFRFVASRHVRQHTIYIGDGSYVMRAGMVIKALSRFEEDQE
jgi:hypothetical protein